MVLFESGKPTMEVPIAGEHEEHFRQSQLRRRGAKQLPIFLHIAPIEAQVDRTMYLGYGLGSLAFRAASM